MERGLAFRDRTACKQVICSLLTLLVGLLFTVPLILLGYFTYHTINGNGTFCTLWIDIPVRLVIFLTCFYIASVCSIFLLPRKYRLKWFRDSFQLWNRNSWKCQFGNLCLSMPSLNIRGRLQRNTVLVKHSPELPLLQQNNQGTPNSCTPIRRRAKPIQITRPKLQVTPVFRTHYSDSSENKTNSSGSLSSISPSEGGIVPVIKDKSSTRQEQNITLNADVHVTEEELPPTNNDQPEVHERNRYFEIAAKTEQERLLELRNSGTQLGFSKLIDKQQTSACTEQELPQDFCNIQELDHPRFPWIYLRDPRGVSEEAKRLHMRNKILEYCETKQYFTRHNPKMQQHITIHNPEMQQHITRHNPEMQQHITRHNPEMQEHIRHDIVQHIMRQNSGIQQHIKRYNTQQQIIRQIIRQNSEMKQLIRENERDVDKLALLKCLEAKVSSQTPTMSNTNFNLAVGNLFNATRSSRIAEQSSNQQIPLRSTTESTSSNNGSSTKHFNQQLQKMANINFGQATNDHPPYPSNFPPVSNLIQRKETENESVEQTTRSQHKLHSEKFQIKKKGRPQIKKEKTNTKHETHMIETWEDSGQAMCESDPSNLAKFKQDSEQTALLRPVTDTAANKSFSCLRMEEFKKKHVHLEENKQSTEEAKKTDLKCVIPSPPSTSDDNDDL